jgi:hypothetical protein
MCYREESEYFRARWKAALRVCGGNPQPGDLPKNREIHEEIVRFEESLKQDAFGLPPEYSLRHAEPGERLRLYETLLLPLEQIHENRQSHPEGDVLYHSLQVFQLAREAQPYDEEFLLAALLHDVGKAIDPKEHVAAALVALDGSITARTAWLIEHHVEALQMRDGTLGVRSRHRLESSADFDDLVLLADCDRQGRARGVTVPDVIDALAYVRSLPEAGDE